MSASSYKNILQSSLLIGGASLINILIGMVRTKFIAVLLGPLGVGLAGTYGSIVAIIAGFSGMGLVNSGVRQLGEADGNDNQDEIAAVVLTLRRCVWGTGIAGTLLMLLFSRQLSRWSFGTEEYSWQIALLSITVLIGAISSGQSCILQGLRRIREVAKINAWGAVYTTGAAIPCYYIWGIKGIVISLILCSLITLAISFYYARQVKLSTVIISRRQAGEIAKKLFRLGFFFMASGLIGMTVTYISGILIVRELGLAQRGLYQSALALSGLMANFVLSAMAMDYFPRLSSATNDADKMNRLVNEQSEIAVLLSLPCILGMIIFAPLGILIFYSQTFEPAIFLIQIFSIGIFGKVISWPLGFVLLARGMGKTFFFTESFAQLFHLAAIYFGIRTWGLNGAAWAFVAMYLAYGVVLGTTVFITTHVIWKRSFARLLLCATGAVILCVMVVFFTYGQWLIYYSTGTVLCLLCAAKCFHQLCRHSKINIFTLLKSKVFSSTKAE